MNKYILIPIILMLSACTSFNEEKIVKWLSYGVQPTETVFQLLKKSNLIKV
jgi:ribosomal protein S16